MSNASKPTFTRRVLARSLDAVLLIAVTLGISTVASDATGIDNALTMHPGVGAPLADLIVLVVGGAYLAIVGVGALFAGRTPGRLLTGLHIARSDGAAASAQQIFGRDVLRTGLFVLAFALLVPAVKPAQDYAAYVGITNASFNVATHYGLPVFATLALTGGFAAADPAGRGLHDRVAGTMTRRT